ncbi:MAG: glycerol kinase GlpK [Candidatus Hydrogenedentes bacterium]|nr:glycerol kinase GlpK [Candidatus Hydrogenedentota bacterium]
MNYLLSMDQGTTSSRSLLFNETGQSCALAQAEYPQIYPRPGWVEHDPRAIWDTQLSVARQVLAARGIAPTQIAAIGITNQRETTVVWDRATGEPVYNAIVWQDRRTAEHCDTLRAAGHGRLIQQKTGLVLDAYFSGTKLAWILDNVEGARARAERGDLAFGTIDTWLVWKLTGGRCHITDASNASRTLLFNIHTGAWDAELLSLLNIPPNLLPEVRDSSEVYAETDAEWLGTSIPIAGMAGDQQAALFGQQCIHPGMAKNTYGTGCFLLMHTGAEAVASTNNLLTTVAWRLRGQLEYALEGSVFIGGALVQWLRDELGLIQHASEIESLARSVPDSGGVYCVPAFTGLGAPHWDQYARGAILGLTRGSSKAHIARAALEAIAWQSADVLRAMEADAGTPVKELRVDGGAAANNLLMQLQADILQAPVVRSRVLETTALGAAFLAGLAVGFWPDRETLAAQWQADRRFTPEMDTDTRDKARRGWEKALERAKHWEEH